MLPLCASVVASANPGAGEYKLMGLTAQKHPRFRSCPSLDALLLDGHHRQMLACMRIYGRSGLNVGAVVGESDAWQAWSLKSHWCSLSAVVPDVEQGADTFASALLSLLEEYPARMVVPSYDGSIAAIRTRRTEFERRTALPLASEAALDIAVSKVRTLALAEDLGIAIPRSITVSDLADVPPALHDIGCPVVIKPVQSWVECDGIGIRLFSSIALTEDEAKRALDDLFAAGSQAVIQQWLPGKREAVSLFFARDRFWGRFAQVSYREWPPLGGGAALCEGIPLLPDITEASERLVRAMDLEGCSMVEFRRDREGRPVLMEVNPRMGGSVALAVSSGVNFPQMLRAWALGEPLQEATGYRIGRRLRWFEGDVRNLKSTFHSQGHPDIPSPARAVTTFLTDFVVRPSAFNVVDMSDIKPELAQMRKNLLLPIWRRVYRLSPMSYVHQKGKTW